MFGAFVLFSAVVLASAAISDVRKREVSDLHWLALFAIGVLNQAMEYDLLSIAGILLLGLYVFTDHFPRIALISSAVMFILSGNYQILFMSFIMIAAYHFGVIRGGADAKAIISISIAFPYYPEYSCWIPEQPVSYVLCPAFSILLLSLILSMSVAFYNIAMSLKSGKIDVSGYELDIETAKKSFVWPTEDIVGGKKKRTGVTDESAYQRLTEAGYRKARVTPMIPFILPIAVSFAVVMIAGWTPLSIIT